MRVKNVIVDIVIVVLCISAFALFHLSGILPMLLMLLIGFGLHCATYAFLALKNKDYDEAMVQMNSILAGNEMHYDEYMDKLKKFKNKRPEYDDVISEFIQRSKSFSKKEEALQELIALNGDKAKKFLTERSDAARAFMYANLKKLVMSIIAYDATSKRNRTESIEEDDGVKEVLQNINEITDLYDRLLSEVTKMDHDINLEDPGLRDVIENLQELRLGMNNFRSEDDEIHLFVSPTSNEGRNIPMGGH